MKLRLAPRLEQQQVLAPQMILSMDILLLSSIDLENRIEREFMENPALELDEKLGQPDAEPAAEKRDPEVEQLLDKLDAFERRYGGDERPRARVGGEDDAKYEALQNHADRPSGLLGHLCEQVGYLDLDVETARLCRELAGNIDRRGFLMGTLEVRTTKDRWAECSIVGVTDELNGVAPGDSIRNEVYDPQRTREFVFAGAVANTLYSQEEIGKLIEGFGGRLVDKTDVTTDVVILGAGYDSDENFKRGEQLYLQTMTESELLRQLGR